MSRRPVPGSVLRRVSKQMRRLRREEDGQTLLLGIGLICIVFALLFIAASATAVYLDLKTCWLDLPQGGPDGGDPR